jgi:hypothetical protein
MILFHFHPLIAFKLCLNQSSALRRYPRTLQATTSSVFCSYFDNKLFLWEKLNKVHSHDIQPRHRALHCYVLRIASTAGVAASAAARPELRVAARTAH